MSHTNSTPNYNLPQFVGTDKPTWLNDVNGAFAGIDTQMKANADSATEANTNATTAVNNTGTLANLNTTDKTSLVNAVNEVNTNLGVVSGVASNASSTATDAKNTADDLSKYLTLVDFNALTGTVTGGSINDQNLREAVNTDKTVAKVYGVIAFNVTSTNGCTVTIPTSIRPTENMTIAGTMLLTYEDGSLAFIHEYSINTNGVITVSLGSGWYNRQHVRLNFIGCMTFFKNFGDTPTPQA